MANQRHECPARVLGAMQAAETRLENETDPASTTLPAWAREKPYNTRLKDGFDALEGKHKS